MKNKLYICFTTFLFCIIIPVYSQNNPNNIWADINESLIENSTNREIIPRNYRTLVLNLYEIKRILDLTPAEFSDEAKTSNILIELPLPEGGFCQFTILESSIMEPELAQKYPEFKTYIGKGLTKGVYNMRFDLTPSGFHAIVRTINGTFYIDPYSRGNITNYISYYKKDYQLKPNNLFICNTNLAKEDEEAETVRNILLNGFDYRVGEELRIYRLALATTGEYTIFHGGTVEAGMNAIVVALNRLNQIFENEVAIRLVLVANNDILIYTNPGNDPYSNSNGYAMLDQNQNNLDGVIGNTNYDIGHVFGTNGGSVAQPYVVCRTGFKARGVTQREEPVGDPYYVDGFAHEVGHQFGAGHTFNGDGAGCFDGNNNETAYEPGSGSTIMGYAGLCGSQNLQEFNDDYFHGISQDNIIAYSTQGSGSSCTVIIPTGNNAPIVTVAQGGFTIPINTPFSLIGSAVDPDNDEMTYCWEEFDLGPVGHPNFPSGNAPIFRSFRPAHSPERVFPQVSDLINNTQTIGEILPSYSRNLTFRLTARDNKPGGGGVGKSSNVSFNVTNTAGPFLVTYPNTNVTIPALSDILVGWNVANTNSSPVNCNAVDILLSTDGGITFPIILSSNSVNDGAEEVTIPDEQTETARIKVKASDNIFFDISNVNFTITKPLPVEMISFTGTLLKDKIKLEWVTITEINNYGFDIERFSFQKNWERIGFVTGNSNSNSPKFYFFTDEYLQGLSKIVYRLKQINVDGSFSYSNEIEFDVTPTMVKLEQNYPNPFNPMTVIEFQLPKKEFVSLRVFNSLGAEIAELINEVKDAGIHEIIFYSNSLTSGVYFYTLKTASFIRTNKMLLLK